MQSVPQVSQLYVTNDSPWVLTPLCAPDEDAPFASVVASVALIGREDFDVV